MEVETFLMPGLRLGYANEVEPAPSLSLVIEVSKMITVIRLRLREGLGNISLR